MNKLEVHADFSPAGDQEKAINELKSSIQNGNKFSVLKGITGSGKSATIAWLIEELQKPTLILAPNKALAAQLANEFKRFFPNNRVEYFVSYYDYYQPEAYVPKSDTYIEKDANINEEIDRLRHSATSALLMRDDVIIVSSVSCIYGLGSPKEYENHMIPFVVGNDYDLEKVLKQLISQQYKRNDLVVNRGNFRLRGDTLDVFPVYEDTIWRFEFFVDKLERVNRIDSITGEVIESLTEVAIFPATHYATTREIINDIIPVIDEDLHIAIKEFKSKDKLLEAQRIEQRTLFDLEMLQEVGVCSGIENYSRYFDGRKPGERPWTLIDFFPKDFITIIDESHVTFPQIKGMHNGDRKRKENLIEHGFRLPAAYDNRPLTIDEFESIQNQMIYVSATPAEKELNLSSGVVTELINRPTGLLDPMVSIRPSSGQIDHLISEIKKRAIKKERCLVTTLTKKMAEDLSEYLSTMNIRVRYLHSEIRTIERVKILRDLRLGNFDVLVGINLLREGLDLPEVSLVAILDADKGGFLRSKSSLVQIAGRASRNIRGKVILYANQKTDSMQYLVDETSRRRDIQEHFNKENNITPKSIKKSTDEILGATKVAEAFKENEIQIKHDIKTDRFLKEDKKIAVEMIRQEMLEAAENLEFEKAASLRDEIVNLQKEIKIAN